MKKIVKCYILFLILFVIGTSRTNALLIKDELLVVSQDETLNDIFQLGSISAMNFFKMNNVGNSSIYCVNPKKDAPYWQNYRVDHILAEEDSNDGFILARDYGFLEILSQGYIKNSQESFDCRVPGTGNDCSVSGIAYRLATNIALRAFYSVMHASNDKPIEGDKAFASANLGFSWAALTPEYLNWSNTVLGTNYTKKEEFGRRVVGTNNWNQSMYSYDESKPESAAYKIIYAAQKLFYEGLKASYTYKTKESISSRSVIKNISKGSTTQTQNNVTTEYISYQIKINNLIKNGSYLRNFSWSCPNCSANGTNFQRLEYSLDGTSWSVLNQNKNIVEDLKDINGYITTNIYIRAVLTKNSNNTNCKSVDFTISYDLHDSNIKYQAAFLIPIYNNFQDMYAVERIDVIKKEITGKVSCSGDTPCEAMIKNPVCDKDTTKDVGSYSIEDIKKCVINKTDEANNSYELYKTNINGESHGGLVAVGEEKNPYCSVYCKEDYNEIKLSPIIQGANCGRDFKLTSHIEGTKSCYAGSANTNDKSIDKKKFKDDIIQKQTDMINSYNEWAKASSAINNIKQVCPLFLPCYYEAKYNTTTYAPITTNENTGALPLYSKNESNTYGTDADKDELKKSIQTAIEAAIDKAEKSYNEFVKALTNYNACTTGWDNYYQFDQKVRFYYNELQGYTKESTVESPFYSSLRPEDTYLIGVKSKEEVNKAAVEKVMICEGTVDDKYNTCSGNGWIPFDSNIDNNPKWGEFNYNSNYEKAFSDVKFAVVTFDENNLQSDEKNLKSLVNKSFKVSKASFVKKTVSKEQDYESPTNFYQDSYTGAIIVDKGYASNHSFTTLYSRLPISQRNSGGGRYKLYIEGLGEFYDTGKLGRIYDFENTGKISMNNPPAYKTNTVGYYYKDKETTFDGSYSCEYRNNCIPYAPIGGGPTCPQCESSCTGDNCSWSDCPTCKAICIECIFNEGKLDIISKTISTTNVKGANRSYGYNWITIDELTNIELPDGYNSKVLNIIAAKATQTIEDIQNINEEIYKDSDGSRLAFSIKMDQHVIDTLKKYNADVKDAGGYANNSLTCYDYTDKSGHVYKNIFCYSELIDKLVTDSKVKYTGLVNRVDISERNNDNNAASGGYFTPWVLTDVEGIPSNFVFGSIDGNTNKIIGGPSWK